MEFNSLTVTLRNFIAAFQAGGDRLIPVIHAVLAALIAIDLVLFAAMWVLGGENGLASGIKKILHVGFWVWASTNFHSLAKLFVDSLVKVGILAGGGTNGVELLMDPSQIAGFGLDVSVNLATKIGDLGPFDVNDAMLFGFAYLAIMAAFFCMAIQVFLTMLEYYIATAVVAVLMPFGTLAATRFLAEKAIGAVVAAGIKLMTLAFILAVAGPTLARIKFAEDPTLNDAWSLLLHSAALALLTIRAPALASGLLAGSPSLTASDVSRSVSTLVSTVVSGTRSVVGTLAGSASSAPTAAAAAAAPLAMSGVSAPSRATGSAAPSYSAPPAPPAAPAPSTASASTAPAPAPVPPQPASPNAAQPAAPSAVAAHQPYRSAASPGQPTAAPVPYSPAQPSTALPYAWAAPPQGSPGAAHTGPTTQPSGAPAPPNATSHSTTAVPAAPPPAGSASASPNASSAPVAPPAATAPSAAAPTAPPLQASTSSAASPPTSPAHPSNSPPPTAPPLPKRS